MGLFSKLRTRQTVQPDWLARHSEPTIDVLLAGLTEETRQLYREYLAEDLRSPRTGGVRPAWRAFDRATCEVLRRNKARRL